MQMLRETGARELAMTDGQILATGFALLVLVALYVYAKKGWSE